MNALATVGVIFATIVLMREAGMAYLRKERRIAACMHNWNKPFWGMGTWNRNCLCCDHQQHSQDGENWA